MGRSTIPTGEDFGGITHVPPGCDGMRVKGYMGFDATYCYLAETGQKRYLSWVVRYGEVVDVQEHKRKREARAAAWEARQHDRAPREIRIRHKLKYSKPTHTVDDLINLFF